MMLMAAARAWLAPLMNGKSTMGSVMIRPPPISKVVMYWLQETKKVKSEATTKPGKMRAA